LLFLAVNFYFYFSFFLKKKKQFELKKDINEEESRMDHSVLV